MIAVSVPPVEFTRTVVPVVADVAEVEKMNVFWNALF